MSRYENEQTTARERDLTANTMSWDERKEMLFFGVNEQTPSTFRLKFITNGNNTAVLGSFHKVNPQELRHFVRNFQISWVNA